MTQPDPLGLQALFGVQRAWRWRAVQTSAGERQTILRRLWAGTRQHRARRRLER